MNTESFQSEGHATVLGSLDASLLLKCKEEVSNLFNVPSYRERSVTVRSVFERSPEKFSPYILLEDIPESEIFIGPSPHGHSRVFRTLVCEQLVWQFASKCLDVPLEKLVLNYSQIIRKAPSCSPRVSWHRDFGNNHISTQNSCHMVRILIPLQKYSSLSGETAVVPKSHFITDKEALGKNRLDSSKCKSDSVNLGIGSGDMLAINSKSIHGSEINETSNYRDQLVVQFAVEGVEYYKSLGAVNSEPYYLSTRSEICA